MMLPVFRRAYVTRCVASLRRRLLMAPPSRGAIYGRSLSTTASPFESLQMCEFLVSEAIISNGWHRAATRLVSSLCGVSVGVSLMWLAVSGAESLQVVSSVRRQDAYLTEARNGGQQLLGPFARNFVRKNSGRLIDQAYTFSSGAPLGAGTFGVVYHATHNGTGIERAVKRIDKAHVSDSAVLRREVETMRLMDHPNVCRLIEYFESDRYLWLVMEICRGEELCDRIIGAGVAGLSEQEAATLMKQMLRSVLHCHGRAVIHRDLKPENFMFSQGSRHTDHEDCGIDNLKLIDFGFSVLGTPQTTGAANTTSLTAGTTLYASPQTLSGEAASESEDVWSLGVIFHILLTGRFPFSTSDDDRLKELYHQGLLEIDLQCHLGKVVASPGALDLLLQMLQFELSSRISVQGALQHPFIAQAFGDAACSEQVLPHNSLSLSASSRTAAVGQCSCDDLYERCVLFMKACRLRRVAAAAMARLMDEQAPGVFIPQGAARDTFLALDRSEAGAVSLSELQQLVSSETRRRFEFADVSSERTSLNYSDFLAATVLPEEDVDDRLCKAAFELLDEDRDGMISPGDLQRRLELPPQECGSAIFEAIAACERSAGSGDCGSSGLNFPSFLRMMQEPLRNGFARRD